MKYCRPLLALALVVGTLVAATNAHADAITEARRLVDEGFPDSAAALLRHALTKLDGDALQRTRMELGLIETDPVNAVAELKGVAVLAPGRRGAALLAAGEILMMTGEHLRASEFLLEAASLKEPEISERASYLHALSLYAAGKFEESRQKWADHLMEYLEGIYQPAARIGIASANISLGRKREAVEIFKAVLAQHPGIDEEPWILSTMAELLIDNPAEAVKYTEKLARDYPDADRVFSEFASPQASPTVTAARPVTTQPSAQPSAAVSRQDSPPQRPSQPARPPQAPRAEDTRPAQPAARPPDPPSRPSAPQVAPPASTVRFVVQAGAFGNRSNAEALVQRLKREGFAAEIMKKGELNAVIAGTFSNRADADRAASKIEPITGERPRITEIR